MASRTLTGWLLAIVLLIAGIALVGCENDDPVANDVETVRINGEAFFLELANTNDKRIRGLSGREQIADDGGMLFVFPRPRVLAFVMRDCLVPIDIAFLDQFGTVTATHEMPIQPRRPGEGDQAYERRLDNYSSRAAAMFAIELRSGKLAELGLEVGDRVELDVARLQRAAR